MFERRLRTWRESWSIRSDRGSPQGKRRHGASVHIKKTQSAGDLLRDRTLHRLRDDRRRQAEHPYMHHPFTERDAGTDPVRCISSKGGLVDEDKTL